MSHQLYMIAIAKSNTADWAEGSPNLQHPHSDRTMGRGAAAHSKYMANEYNAVKLKQTTSVLMQES